MATEEKTELSAELVAERERIRAALVRYGLARGYTVEIETAWEHAYPGVPLRADVPPTDDSPSEAVLAERRRLAHVMVELAREESWCGEAARIWRLTMPGVEFRDKDGYDCQGYNAAGKHRLDDPANRPARPSENSRWCDSCRAWES